jgi:arylsulfatase A-like enzyme
MKLHWLIVLTAFGLLITPARAQDQAPPRPPNIVFILADDLGINDLACYGRKDHETPNLDRLARQGMRFSSAYAAASICSPTRAAILTGKSPARLHLTTFLPGRPDRPSQLLLHPVINQQLPARVQTLADLLKEAVYRSACIGKWHLGGKGSLPTDRGFDLYHPGQALTEPSATEGGKGEYDLTAHAEKFIEDNKGRPFFLYLAHNNPHVVLRARPELIEKHKNAFNPIYAAMIETLDDCVGRIVARLEALGLAENTIIIFTSDNGGLHVLESPHTPATYNRPWRAGKGFLFEGGVRVPLIVRWSGKIKAGQTIDTPVISTDWTPTLLALAGVGSQVAYDGVDFSELLTRNKAPPPRALYWHQPHYTNQGGKPAGAIRDGDWKLIEHYETGACELFHLGKDPGETTDLGASQPARLAELRGKLEKWRRDMGAQSNSANPQYNGKLAQAIARTDVSSIAWDETATAMAPKMQAWRALMDQGPKKASPGAGAVLLHARDATVHGSKLHYEGAPHKDTLGSWVRKDDWVEWSFTAPGTGTFAVKLLQGCGQGSGGAKIEIAVGGQKLTTTVVETGHFQRFMPIQGGMVKLTAKESYTLSVRALTKPGAAVMDLRRVTVKAAAQPR